MNYMNMFMVIPSIKMVQINDHKVSVTYFYKAPWRWAQYYWMGFATIFTAIPLCIFLPVMLLVGIQEKMDWKELTLNLLGLSLFALVGLLFLGVGLYFRRDLMQKAQSKVQQFVSIIQTP